MRVIYVDVLITVNIFVDFFLILCTKKFLHIKASYKRMILGGLSGGIFSLIALLPAMPFFKNIIINIIGACTIVFITFGKCSVKAYIKRVTVYYSFSFSFCGIMIFIYTAFKPYGMEIYNDIVYFNISPVILILLTLVCYYILRLIKRLTKGIDGGGVCNVEICIDNKSYCFCAKIDTGCNLKEPFSADYVIVTEKNLIDGYEPESKKTRVIPFESLGGKGIINGFKPDKIKIDNKDIENSIYIGICENILKGDIKALIPYELINSIK